MAPNIELLSRDVSLSVQRDRSTLFLVFLLYFACLASPVLHAIENPAKTIPGDISKDRVPADWVDPLIGTGPSKLPTPTGIVTSWWDAKQRSGNTHPGPTTPHGMVSMTPFGGGYPTGYSGTAAVGFTHFQQSGAGNLAQFYNFFLVRPVTGPLVTDGPTTPITKELASPGFYSMDFGKTGISVAVTVTSHCAFHSYTFPAVAPAHLVIDLSTTAREKHMGAVRAKSIKIASSSPGAVAGSMTFESQPTLYFQLETNLPSTVLAAWSGKEVTATISPEVLAPKQPAGIVLSGTAPQEPVLLKVGFSFRSVEQAKANLTREIPAWNFKATADAARASWNNAMSQIKIEGGTDDQRTIFYTALYHSLIKPIDLTGESPFWSDERPLYLDIATIWDVYKTHLPMLMTFYPERGTAVVNSLLSTFEHFQFDSASRMAFMIQNTQGAGFNYQGTALAHQVILNAYAIGLPGIDWAKAYHTLLKAMGKPTEKPPKHVVDDSYASFLLAALAKERGDQSTAELLLERSRRWKAGYDPKTALLTGETYEGLAANYSWQVWHDLPALIAMHGGIESALRERDLFFGFIPEPADLPAWSSTASNNTVTGAKVPPEMKMAHFQGLNNQPDIDSFLPYYQMGRPDRAVDVVRAALAYRFATGRGGLAGNDDSGGTSSWYVCNALGLQPLCGMDRLYIGSPLFTRITINAGKKPFIVETVNASDANRYVVKATWEGKTLEQPWIRASYVREGGHLILTMGPKAVAWMSPL